MIYVVKAEPDDELYLLWSTYDDMPLDWWDDGFNVFTRETYRQLACPPHRRFEDRWLDHADATGTSFGGDAQWGKRMVVAGMADVHHRWLSHCDALIFTLLLLAGEQTAAYALTAPSHPR